VGYQAFYRSCYTLNITSKNIKCRLDYNRKKHNDQCG
jgi:hypothetical protein